jgi:hypothetical protein
MSAVNPCDAQDEREAAFVGRHARTLSDPNILDGLACQEASILSRETYIPCGVLGAAVVWHGKDRRAYVMCAPCAWHNVRNRGGRLLMATDRRAIP